MTFPIPVSNFADFVPHRPPMVWVDEVVASTETDGECRVRLKADALYMQDGFARKTSFVEWIAQAFAYARAAYLSPKGMGKLNQAFLVAIRDAEYFFDDGDPDLSAGGEFHIYVSQFRDVGPIMMFNGEVRKEKRTLMRANLRVYQS